MLISISVQYIYIQYMGKKRVEEWSLLYVEEILLISCSNSIKPTFCTDSVCVINY